MSNSDFSQIFAELGNLSMRLANDEIFVQKLDAATEQISQSILAGGKLIIAGNGGSAADADHFAGELVGRFLNHGRRSLPAISLSTNGATFSAIGNDFGYDKTFLRQLEGLGKCGDVFFAISTSGNSPNILEALRFARNNGIYTIALLGKTGGEAKNLCDIAIIVSHDCTPRVQEIHIAVIHALCERLDSL